MNVYLQPHSDDICFSLGAFAFNRHCGVVLTVCPISGYVPTSPGKKRPLARLVTETRMEEDRAFCRAGGLEARFLNIPCSSYLGYEPFVLGRVDENMQRIGEPMIDELRTLAMEGQYETRPWLFCAGGIGGHVDHMAIRTAVSKPYRALSPN